MMSLRRAKDIANTPANHPVKDLRKAKLSLINAGDFTRANRIAAYLGDPLYVNPWAK